MCRASLSQAGEHQGMYAGGQDSMPAPAGALETFEALSSRPVGAAVHTGSIRPVDLFKHVIPAAGEHMLAPRCPHCDSLLGPADEPQYVTAEFFLIGRDEPGDAMSDNGLRASAVGNQCWYP